MLADGLQHRRRIELRPEEHHAELLPADAFDHLGCIKQAVFVEVE